LFKRVASSGGLPSVISLRGRLLIVAFAATVVALPHVDAGQGPVEPPGLPDPATQTLSTYPSGQTQRASGQQEETGGKPTQSTQPGTATGEPKELLRIPERDKTKIKVRSEADVEAIGSRGVGKGVNLYSLDKEIALGKRLAQEVERSSKLVDDRVVSEYINRVGQNLVRNSDARVPFTIKVIDSEQIDATALPGGFFYVNSGLILATDSEAELSGVMAHEIAHVAARDSTKSETKRQFVQLAAFSLTLLGPAGTVGYQALTIAVPLTFLKFSRDNERRADYLGLQYMYKAGYDPNAFVGFFEKMEAQQKERPGMVAKFFLTHPPTSDRVRNVQNEIAEILPPLDQYIVTTSEFDTVKARLRRTDRRLQNGKNTMNEPTLYIRTEQQKSDSGRQPANQVDVSEQSHDPTLHKRTAEDPDQQ
jgi:beta-barrel assembly-enhancing protease